MDDFFEGLGKWFAKNGAKGVIKWAIILIVGWNVLSFGIQTIRKSFVSVPAGTRGVVMAFGQVQPVVLSEGLHTIMPWRDSVVLMSVQILRTDLKMAAASGDMQDVHSEVVINWSLNANSANKIYQTVGDEEMFANKIIAPAVLESFKAATARRHADEILQKREELRAEFDEALHQKLKDYPIVIVATSITSIDFSPEYKKAIEEKQVAQQEAQKAVYVAQQAKNEAQAAINKAYGVAQANKLKSLTVTPKILALEWIHAWNGVLPTFISGNSSSFMIDLSKVMKMTGGDSKVDVKEPTQATSESEDGQ